MIWTMDHWIVFIETRAVWNNDFHEEISALGAWRIATVGVWQDFDKSQVLNSGSDFRERFRGQGGNIGKHSFE